MGTISGGPSTICAGGSATLTSSSAGGNQWYLNGSPIGGATAQTYNASVSGDYTVVVTSSGCSSAASAAFTLTVIPHPNATISVASPMAAGATATASVPDGGANAQYTWSIANGTINSGNGTRTINFTAGAAGTLTLGATVNVFTCGDVQSANVTVRTVSDG